MLQKAKDDEQELTILINKLNNGYNPRNQIKIKEKDNALNFGNMREEIISAFKEGIFPYIDGIQVEKETDEETDKETDEKSMPENEEIDTKNMPELESKESTAQGKEQKAKGLKILTPNQMLSRLPISLPQLKARKNSEKLKNEIRQILYYLCRSKKRTKKKF